MYFIKKFIEFFFPKIDENIQIEGLSFLSTKEKEYFLEMGKYDRYHSLEVYKKMKNTFLKYDAIYLKMALLHDCGKVKVCFITRVLHKLGFKTKIINHEEKGYEKLKNIDKELAILIKNHHKKNYSKEMEIFRKCDDES